MIEITERKDMTTITSMEVAETVGKTHANLLKDIRNYAEQLAEVSFHSGDFFRRKHISRWE